MHNKKIYGKSRVRDKGGVLRVKKYLRIPYSLMRSKDFLDLDALSVKIYLLLLKEWFTNNPDEPVEISFGKFRELCSRKINGKITKPSYTTLTQAIQQLMVFGFIHKETRYKQCNKYWIEQKWFTGEYH